MACAVVENAKGKITHHTNVLSVGIQLSRGKSAVRLTLIDGSEQIVEGAISGRLVDDLWYVEKASGLIPQ